METNEGMGRVPPPGFETVRKGAGWRVSSTSLDSPMPAVEPELPADIGAPAGSHRGFRSPSGRRGVPGARLPGPPAPALGRIEPPLHSPGGEVPRRRWRKREEGREGFKEPYPARSSPG